MFIIKVAPDCEPYRTGRTVSRLVDPGGLCDHE